MSSINSRLMDINVINVVCNVVCSISTGHSPLDESVDLLFDWSKTSDELWDANKEGSLQD